MLLIKFKEKKHTYRKIKATHENGLIFLEGKNQENFSPCTKFEIFQNSSMKSLNFRQVSPLFMSIG